MIRKILNPGCRYNHIITIVPFFYYRACFFRRTGQKSSYSMNHQFDIMLSYCWAEKTVSKPIFESLSKKGYRVWFDEQNMHGDSLQAMANGIQNSLCIVICISENYEKSNACRHEAEYAYTLQRRIVPVLAQPRYKARNWLGFIVGSCIYINFTKY